MAKLMGYAAFLEDQKKKQKEQEQGKVRYVEAAKASRIQYSIPGGYKGKSRDEGSKTYQWEKDFLKNAKIKGVRSYNDRFDVMTKQMGMTPGQAEDFRNYMDWQEDSQHVDPKLNKDGKINQQQSLKYARDTHLQQDVIDGILNKMTNNGAAQVKKYSENEKKREESEKAKRPPSNGFKKVMDTINSGLGNAYDNTLGHLERLATSVTDGITLGQLKKNVDKNENLTPEFVKKASKEPTNKTDKVIDTLGEFAGMTAPVGLAYKPAGLVSKALMGGKEAKYLEAALRGGVAGGIYSGTQQGVDEVVNPEDANLKQRLTNVGLNTALGAVADPALLGLGAAGSNLLGRLAKVDGEIPTYSGNVSDNVLDSLAPNSAKTVKSSDDLYSQLLGQETKPKPQTKADAWNNFKPEETPQVETSFLDEILNGTKKAPTEQDFINQELAPFRESAQAQAQARQTWETVVKGAQKDAQRIKDYYGKIVPDGNSKDMINEIPPQFRAAKSGKGNDIYSFAEEEGFANADEAIAYLKQIDLDSKTRLKDLMPEDDYVLSADEWDGLEQVARQKYNELHGSEKAQTSPQEIMDEMLGFLGENPKNVNNSQAPEQVLEQLAQPKGGKKLTIDELNALIRGEQPKKAEAEAVNPAPVSEEVAAGKDEPLVRLDIQQFGPSTATSLVETRAPISTESPIAKIQNPVKRAVNKFYEGYVNRNHSAKVTETQSLETAIKRAQAEGKPKKAEQLQQRLKQVKKSGSDFDKALGNELASGSAAKNFLDRNFASLSETMGGDMKEMSGALEFQMAKNLDYIKRNVDPNYELPNGWDWGDINRIINSGANNAKYGEFINQFRNMTQEWRDTMLDYGLISKESHEALGQNPYYIPMQRDMSQVFDNIDVGYAGIGDKGRGAGNGIVKALDGGSVDTFFKNPLETVIDNSFRLYKNAYRNDTAQQALKMAELDKDGSLGLAKEVSERNKKPGDLTVFVNGQKRYVRLQDDLVKMMNENESTLDLGKIGKVTQLFAALKTRSFEYQTAAAPRDMVQAYVTSQVSNPVRYLGEVFKAIKNKNASAKEVGAYFDKAYNDHVAGVDPKKILKEFQQKAGNVKVFSVKDPESWKQVGGVVKKILDTPFKPSKFLGQITDEIPREIEVREAERLFMKKNGQKMQNIQTALDDINAKIQAAQGAPAFSPQTQGIDKLAGQKEKLENMLRQFNQDLKREQVYRGRDVMDYSRMGNSKATKNIIRPWVIFANTTTQSKDKMIRSFIERPGATIAKATSVVAPFVAAEVINHDNMSGSDRKIYDNLPKWMSQFNYVYVDQGNVYAVPKLQELALLTNPIEAALKGDSLNDSMRLLTKETVPYQLGNVAQGLVPDEDGNTLSNRDPMTKNVMGVTAPSTALGPIADVMFNDKTTFNRKPISFYSDKSNKWTMDLFTGLAGKEPNADALQYLYQQYLGDFGKYTSYGADAALNPSNSKKIDDLLRNLNPLQDRIFKPDSRYFKEPILETKK